MSNDAYPITTNRAGSWAPGAGSTAKRMDRRPELEALSAVTAPLRQRGLQATNLAGLDEQGKALMDLVDNDPQEFSRLARAIQLSVDSSRATHPQFVGADPSEHTISVRETKTRIQWCIDMALRARFDMRPKKSLTWIVEQLPVLLEHHLSGDLEQYLMVKRSFVARDKMPRGLEDAMGRHVVRGEDFGGDDLSDVSADGMEGDAIVP